MASSRAFVGSLRENLHTVHLDADLLGHAAGPPSSAAPRRDPHAVKLRKRRIRRQIESISRAIDLLESTLDAEGREDGPRRSGERICELAGIVADAVTFLVPFARHMRRQIELCEERGSSAEVPIDRCFAWRTVVTVLAERVLALPSDQVLRVGLVPAESSVSGAHVLRLRGPFDERQSDGQGRSKSLDRLLNRLLESRALQSHGIEIEALGVDELRLSFPAE